MAPPHTRHEWQSDPSAPARSRSGGTLRFSGRFDRFWLRRADESAAKLVFLGLAQAAEKAVGARFSAHGRFAQLLEKLLD